MENLRFSIYTSSDGRCPYEEWYATLPKKDREKLDATIQKIMKYGIGEALKMQWVKKLDSDIWEIRSQYSNNIQRACTFHYHQDMWVITHGFTKKTQKTPIKEIQRAHEIRNQILGE